MAPLRFDPDDLEGLQERLRHVRFIGGGSGGGKSTVARQLATTYHMQLYETDPVSQYVARTTPEEHPLLHAFMAMTMDERWVTRSPEIMYHTFHGFQGEQFALILEDLLALPRAIPILAEGFALLPRLVAPLLTVPQQAVFLLPAPAFRVAAFAGRGTLWTIPAQTSDPQRALANLLERDRLFTERVRSEALEYGLPVIEVDGRRSVAELVAQVAAVFGLA